MRLFANDTAAYLAITKLADGQQLQEDLDALQQWEADWDMEFNPGKCQVLQITRSRSPIQTSYTMHGQTLEVVSCAKYLGMDISNDFSWKAHISRITGNVNQSLSLLRRNLKATRPALWEKAYKAIARQQLEYASPVWDPHIQDDISKIEMFRGWRLGGSLGIIRPIQTCQTCCRSLAGEPSSGGTLMHDWSYFIRLYMDMSLSLSLVMLSPLHVSQELHIHWLIDRSCEKYLGMDISNDLSWKAHISLITGNANQCLRFLRRQLKATNPALREKAYKVIVRTQLEYAAPVCDPHIQDNISKIEMFRGWRLGGSSGIIRPIQACQTCWRSLAGEPSSSGALMHDWSYL